MMFCNIQILVLDEVMVFIDIVIDVKIQQMIRESFVDCMVFIIVYCFNIVLYCDVIIIMEVGKVSFKFFYIYCNCDYMLMK